MKRAIIVFVVVVAAVAAGTIYFRREASAATTTYLFVPVTRGTLQSTVSATGTLAAVDSVQVGTQVSGIIDALFADYNDRVHKGELIARLDTTVLKLDVEKASASEEQGRADLRQKQFALQQIKKLLATTAETQTDYETALANASIAAASLKTDSVALAQAKQSLAYAYIYSPIDGIVINRLVQVGQTVAASFSAPELFLIAGDLQDMQIVASVDESDIGQIKKGQDVTFTVEAYPDRIFHGITHQVRLGSSVQDNVVDYPVAVRVKNPDGALLPGMTATLNFQVATDSNVLRVPEAALRFEPTQAMLAEFRAEHPEPLDSTRAGNGGRGDTSGRARNGRNGGRGGGNAIRQNDFGVLWYRDNDSKLEEARVRTGLSDGQYIAVSGPDLHEGMRIIAAVTGGPSASSTVQNPFGGGQQQGRGGRFGGPF
ncbi:MAG: efflux RND transporter periplasmic adaptor subunit [Gemmatimonadaceae bacterium]